MTRSPENPASGAYPWRPAPAIAFTLLLHAAGVTVLVFQPSLWPWVLGGLVVNHVMLIAAVFWPRGRVLGPNLVRLPPAAAARNEVSLNFDDGPDPEVTHACSICSTAIRLAQVFSASARRRLRFRNS